MSVWDEAQAVLNENPQTGIWDKAENIAEMQNQQSLRAFELLNDPNKQIEDYVLPERAKVFSDYFDLADNPQAERQKYVESEMVSVTTGMPFEVAEYILFPERFEIGAKQ